MDVTNHRPTRRVVAIGAVAVGLCVAGTGVAAAAAPTSALSRSVTEILQSAGVDWSTMPDGYTPEQYEAFWGAGYTAENVDELGARLRLGRPEVPQRAGQLILDGQPVPLPAGGAEPTEPTAVLTDAQFQAYWDAGYTAEDIEAIGAIWHSEFVETKARVGQMILDGQTPPVPPSGTPAGQS